MNLTEYRYTDGAGLTRAVLLPDGDTDVTRGIPVSLDITPLFEHAPPGFALALMKALQARGLVMPRDFTAPGAHDLIRSALLATIKQDAMAIIAYAKENLNNG